MQDLRFAFRTLLKNPGFTAVGVLTLALGIGVVTAIFSVVYGILLQPLPYEDPDHLGKVWTKLEAAGIPQNWTSEPEFLEMERYVEVNEGIAAFASVGVNLLEEGTAERIQGAVVTRDFFSVMRVDAIQGRTFSTDETRPGGQSGVALLSYGLWQSRFGEDSGMVGRTIRLDQQDYSVVGILPRGFNYPDGASVWVPHAIDPGNMNSRGSHFLEVIARWPDGVTYEQASAEMVRIGDRIGNENPNYYGAEESARRQGWGVYMRPLLEEFVGGVRGPLYILLAAVGFVLLIACANVANLLLARGAARDREIAIRIALGAGRGRLLRQLLVESVVLAVSGGALGVLLALGGVRLLLRLAPANLPRLEMVSISMPVLLAALGISVLTALLFGLIPALQTSSPDMQTSLKEGGQGTVGSGNRFLRSGLVVLEISCALILLVGAGLMIRSFISLRQVTVGFDPDDVVTLELALPSAGYPDAVSRAAFYREVVPELRAIPGVAEAGGISNLPMSGSYSSGTTTADARTDLPGGVSIEAERRSVVPGYFEAMGIGLLEGRGFTAADDVSATRVAVVDQKYAERFWPGVSAIGKRLKMGNDETDPWFNIVGVVKNVKHYALDVEGREAVYYPYPQRATTGLYLTLKSSTDPRSVVGAARNVISELDPLLPLYNIRPMSEYLSDSVAGPQLNLFLFGIFAAMALLIASVGIYGVMSYSVSQRTAEIGIRMALGARQTDVLRMVVFNGLLLTILGVVIGLGGAWVLSGLVRSLLFGVSNTDATTYLVVALVLSAVALAASFFPARRAARVNPVVALRRE